MRGSILHKETFQARDTNTSMYVDDMMLNEQTLQINNNYDITVDDIAILECISYDELINEGIPGYKWLKSKFRKKPAPVPAAGPDGVIRLGPVPGVPLPAGVKRPPGFTSRLIDGAINKIKKLPILRGAVAAGGGFGIFSALKNAGKSIGDAMGNSFDKGPSEGWGEFLKGVAFDVGLPLTVIYLLYRTIIHMIKSKDDKKKEKKSINEGFLDGFQNVLSAGGLLPGVGIPIDLANAGISLLRGNISDAGVNAVAAVPIVGWGATGVKGVRAVSKSKKLLKGPEKGLADVTPGLKNIAKAKPKTTELVGSIALQGTTDALIPDEASSGVKAALTTAKSNLDPQDYGNLMDSIKSKASTGMLTGIGLLALIGAFLYKSMKSDKRDESEEE